VRLTLYQAPSAMRLTTALSMGMRVSYGIRALNSLSGAPERMLYSPASPMCMGRRRQRTDACHQAGGPMRGIADLAKGGMTRPFWSDPQLDGADRLGGCAVTAANPAVDQER
jgi:hypothetical protein